jgi:hypothetical protein
LARRHAYGPRRTWLPNAAPSSSPRRSLADDLFEEIRENTR